MRTISRRSPGHPGRPTAWRRPGLTYSVAGDALATQTNTFRRRLTCIAKDLIRAAGACPGGLPRRRRSAAVRVITPTVCDIDLRPVKRTREPRCISSDERAQRTDRGATRLQIPADGTQHQRSRDMNNFQSTVCAIVDETYAVSVFFVLSCLASTKVEAT